MPLGTMRAAVASGLCALALAPGAAAKPMLGARGDLVRFDALTGQRSQAGETALGWNQGLTWGGSLERLLATLGDVPVIGIKTGDFQRREAITPLAIARGRGDPYLIALNAAIASWEKRIYMRPFFEMNGYWAPYSAYTRSGRRKDAAHSTTAFRQAFARVYVILHGGAAADVDAKLRRLGLPGVGRDLALNPAPRLRVIWNPQGFSVPQVPGNEPQAYYPGDPYVDVVGNDLIRERGDVPKWTSNDALYAAHRSKPYAFPEWALQAVDDPEFVRRMALFVRTHRRVQLLIYSAGPRGSPFDLAAKPRSLAAYRALIAPLSR